MIEQKWHGMSLTRKILLIGLIIFIGYNLLVNLHLFTQGIRTFFRHIAPFLIGVGIAYLLARPVEKLCHKYELSKTGFVRNKANVLAVITVFLLLILAVTVIMIFITPVIAGNVGDLINNLDLYYANAMDWINSLEPGHFLYSFLPDEDYITSAELLNLIPANAGSETDLVTMITNGILAVVTNVVNFTTSIANFALGLIMALYLLLYKKSVLRFVNRISNVTFSQPTLAFIKEYVAKANDIFYKFISAQFLDACILGTLATILLALLRVEYAVTFGILLGIFNMIPFFGSIIATIVTVFITFFTGNFQQAAITFAALLALQQLDANFINPKITGDSLGLNPLLIVVSIFIGGAYMNVLGMFIGVPIGAILKMFLEDYLVYRENKLGIIPEPVNPVCE